MCFVGDTMWPQAGMNSGPGWNAGNGGSATGQDWATYYQSMPTNQVDWGSLAQQWISMKAENTNMMMPMLDDAEPPPPAPGEEQFVPHQPSPMPEYNQWPPVHLPPPNVHAHDTVKHHQPPLPPAPPLPTTPHPNTQPEGGVADMDMDEDDDNLGSSHSNDWPTGRNVDHSESTNYERGDGYYGKAPENSNSEVIKPSIRPGYQAPSFGGPSPHPPGGGWIHKNNQGMGRGRGGVSTMNQFPPLMGLPVNTNRSIEDGSGYNGSHSYGSSPGIMGSMANLDAAARKKLPPWIREGLEKMEREKQKKEEELLRKQLREEKLRKRREEELKMEEKRKQDPGVSKFDEMNSNSESDEATDIGVLGSSNLSDDDSPEDHKQEYRDAKIKKQEVENTPSQRKRPSRFDTKGPPSNAPKGHEENIEHERTEVKEAPQKHLTKDEILEEMSLILKRTLTEILLEVTTEEIESTAQESLMSARRQKSKSVVNAKIRANRAFKKNPVSTLGLTGYGSGSDNSESESEHSEKKSEDDTSDSNSEDNLEERVRQRKRQFERTESNILDECADLEKNLEIREKIWKEKESNRNRRRHESKNSNHSDHSDKPKNAPPKVFEKISAAVSEVSEINSVIEQKGSKLLLKEDVKIPSNDKKLLSSSLPKAAKGSSVKDDNRYSENDKLLDEERNEGKEKESQGHASKKEKKQKSRKRSSSPDEKKDNLQSRRTRKHRSISKDRNNRSLSRESEKSISFQNKGRTRDKENSEKRSHKSKRRSRSREKYSSRKKSRSRSPKSSKHNRNSRSRSRSRNRSERKRSHRDRHRSKSRDRKSSFADHKISSSRRNRSRSRDGRSRRSRSRSTEKRPLRKNRHNSTSSETSTFSHASGAAQSSRRERRDSEMSSSSRLKRRSRS